MYEFTTNYHRRPIIYGYELSAAQRAEFDYIDWDAVDRDWDSRSFVLYRGDLYDLSDVEMAPDDIKRFGWDGFNSDSYFSGVAFRYFDADGNLLDDGDSVIVARVYVTSD